MPLVAHLPLAHSGLPVAPHDLWTAWSLDWFVVFGLIGAVVAYRRGRPDTTLVSRVVRFHLAVVALAAALLSPLDAAADALVSAHMVQHILLLTVAPILLTTCRPLGSLLRGLPESAAQATGHFQGLVLRGLRRRWIRAEPWAAWAAVVLSLWFWHARVPYELAVTNRWVHLAEHSSFFAAGLILWSAVVRAGRSRRGSGGMVLALFGIGFATTLLSALMTFSTRPWYDVYRGRGENLGLSPAADQQLAGVLMWFPNALILAVAALWLLMRLMTAAHRPDAAGRVLAIDR